MESNHTVLRQRLERLSAGQRNALAARLHAPGDEQELAAFVTTNATIDAAGIRSMLAEDAPAHLIPARVHVVESLPRTPNGKLDHRGLVHLDAMQAVNSASPVIRSATATATETMLCRVWSELLGEKDIASADDFFAMGGHSFLILRMVQAIEKEIGRRIAPAVVFRFPVLSALARYLDWEVDASEGLDSRDLKHVFPLVHASSGRPLFFVQPEGFRDLLDSALDGCRPLFGIRGLEPDSAGVCNRWNTMRDLAVEIVDEIRRVQPHPPYAIGGFSFGALMAFEIACLLEERSMEVERLVMFEPSPQVVYRFGALPVMIWESTESVDSLSPARAAWLWAKESHPFCRSCYRKLRRLAGKDIRRWWLAREARKLRATGGEVPMKLLKAEASAERFRLYRNHRRKSFDGRVSFFGSPSSLASFERDWEPVLRGERQLFALPGTHLTFLQPEHRPALRGPLQNVLTGLQPSE
jgi:thioesterase domain-containing protein